MQVSWVIVSYNSPEAIGNCIDSVLRTGSGSDQVVVVDNGSEDCTREVVESYCRRDGRVRAIYNSENSGYARAANQGIGATSGDIVVLLNPDCLVYSPFPRRVQEVPSRLDIGAVGPLSDGVCAHQHVSTHLPEAISASKEDLGGLLNSRFLNETEEVKLLVGFCIALRRDVLETVGPLDAECFLGSGDLDLCWRLGLHGFKLLIAKDCFVHHEVGASFKSLLPVDRREFVHKSNMALVAKPKSPLRQPCRDHVDGPLGLANL